MLSKSQTAEVSGWAFQNSGKIIPVFLCISEVKWEGHHLPLPQEQCNDEFIQSPEAPVSRNTEEISENMHIMQAGLV